ncbi:hypothetical protein FLP41_14595 [Paracoccus marcusii]|nr:hypothetical protein FLP41_14595 [Paracoccus marcusii]
MQQPVVGAQPVPALHHRLPRQDRAMGVHDGPGWPELPEVKTI